MKKNNHKMALQFFLMAILFTLLIPSLSLAGWNLKNIATEYGTRSFLVYQLEPGELMPVDNTLIISDGNNEQRYTCDLFRHPNHLDMYRCTDESQENPRPVHLRILKNGL